MIQLCFYACVSCLWPFTCSVSIWKEANAILKVKSLVLVSMLQTIYGDIFCFLFFFLLVFLCECHMRIVYERPVCQEWERLTQREFEIDCLGNPLIPKCRFGSQGFVLFLAHFFSLSLLSNMSETLWCWLAQAAVSVTTFPLRLITQHPIITYSSALSAYMTANNRIWLSEI